MTMPHESKETPHRDDPKRFPAVESKEGERREEVKEAPDPAEDKDGSA